MSSLDERIYKLMNGLNLLKSAQSVKGDSTVYYNYETINQYDLDFSGTNTQGGTIRNLVLVLETPQIEIPEASVELTLWIDGVRVDQKSIYDGNWRVQPLAQRQTEPNIDKASRQVIFVFQIIAYGTTRIQAKGRVVSPAGGEGTEMTASVEVVSG